MPFVHVWSLHKHGVLGCSTHDPAVSRGSKEVQVKDVGREGKDEDREGRGKGRERGEREGREGMNGGRRIKGEGEKEGE